MPWCFPWPDYIKKKACRYLLQHYVGNFLEEKLTLDQLSVDLYSGTGTVKDVKLDVWNLNEVLESVGAPVEIRDGSVSSISVEIPWSSLLTANSKVEIKGLEITIQPKYRVDTPGSTASMGDSMWSSMSMTNSMQLAQECLKQESEGEQAEASNSSPFEGPELLAQTIESVLTRVELTLIDTLIRLEHVPQGSTSGVALEVHIERLRFFDEVSRDTLMDHGSSVDQEQLHNFTPAAIAHKNLQMMGVTIHCEEFPEEQRLSTSASPESDRYGKDGGNAFEAMASSPEMPPQHHEVGAKTSSKTLTEEQQELLESCIIGECTGKQEIKLKIKQNEQISGPKAEIETYLGSINLFFSPRQVHLLLELINGFLSPATSDTACVRGKQANKPMKAEDYQRIESDLQERFLQQQKQEDILRRQSWGLHGDEEDIMEPMLDQSIDDSDLFFSMTGSMMSMASPNHFADDMESSISSTISTTSTDTSRTGSSISRLGYGTPYYRGVNSSPFASTMPKGTAKKKSKRALSDHLDDPHAEVTRYKVRFSSMSVTILHEDPPHMPQAASTTIYPSTNGSTSPPARSSPPKAPPGKTASQTLQERAENYFLVLGRQGYGMKSQGEWKEKFARACPYDHLRLVAAPVTLECEKKYNNVVSYISLDVSLGTVELLECLFERHNSELLMSVAGTPDPRPPTPNHIEILSFAEERSGNVTDAYKPCVHLRLKHIEKNASQSSHHRSLSKPKTELTVELGALRCEVDISIVDRLYALLHPQPGGQYRDSTNGRYTSLSAHGGMQNKQALFAETLEESSTISNNLLSISVSCSKAHVAFRFPIPDLRDMTTIAWWKRSLRDEILYVELQETYFKTRMGEESTHQTLLLECKEIHCSLQLNPQESPISFIRINPSQGEGMTEGGRFYWPRLLMKLYPAKETSVLEEESEMGDSMLPTPQNSWEEICQFDESEPSPFSSKKVMYESEQMIMPGDSEEMKEFMQHCLGDARVTLDITIPRVNILLPSKEFMETLYNRFANDLLLWQSAAPTPRDHPDSYMSYGISGGLDMTQIIGANDKFAMCRSAAAFDSDSDEEDDSGRFLTFDDRQGMQRRKRNSHHKTSPLQHLLALTLNINHGKLTICGSVKGADGATSPNTHGETMLELEDGQLFTVANYKGDANLSHLCMQTNRFAIYHNGEVDTLHGHEPIPPANWTRADYLQCCLYLSDEGVPTKTGQRVGRGETSEKMFALAMKMCYDPQKNVKTMECAIGVRGTTLQHYASKPEHSWMVQIGDFFDVLDEPVLGYDMPRVVTELHTHFWGCGIDYRPLYLPLRTFIGIETLSISSNLVYESKESLLRFLIDDAALYLSDKCNEQKVDLKRNYVCVLDVGLLELALRLSTDKNRNPKLDLKVTNNTVHIRTCADSCSTLTKLLLYLANDGDLKGPPLDADEQPEEFMSQSGVPEPVNISKPNTKPATTPVKPSPDSPVRTGHMEQMHQLMEEAMKELNQKSPTDEGIGEGEGPVLHLPCTLKHSPNSEVFLFPDEDVDDTFQDINRTPPTSKPAPIQPHQPRSQPQFPQMVTQHFDGGASDEVQSDGSDIFDDDDFCVLDDPGMGVMPRNGEPEVKCLDDNPIHIKEDHFSKPLGRGDQLNAPSHFPTPVMKYTLQEMTLVWHVYGGNDLGPAKKVKKPESRSSSPAHVTVGTPERKSHGDTQSSPSSKKLQHRTINPNQLSLQERGGPGRDHSVLMELQLNKVRFRHEVYPEDTVQASRQILVISNIEIRDRLAESQINKFLYLYSSEARPKRTHANMVLVKALHMRPDLNLSAEECCLRVSLQPLRLNIDQDALFFLRDFFTEVSVDATKMPTYPESRRSSIASRASTAPSSGQPSLSSQHGSIATTQTSLATTRHSLQFEEDSNASSAAPLIDFSPMSTTLLADSSIQQSSSPSIQSTDSTTTSSSTTVAPPVFFRSFVFSPDVPIKLDYEGKRVDMEQGTLIGLLIGLGQLNKSELTLKRLLNRHGLLGIDKLLVYAVNEWAQDIKSRQLPGILGGVGPMHSFVQLVQGTVDLFRLPIEQYQKDGRLMRGFQRGANSFGTSTAMACVELTNRMVRVLQTAAETAYDIVSPGPSVTQRAITYGPFGQQRLARQPTDFREGMANAITVVREGLGDTANAMLQVAVEEHEHKGVSGAVGGILRQIPPSVIKPFILATEATSSVLGGMRNQMLPDARKEDQEKWRSEKT